LSLYAKSIWQCLHGRLGQHVSPNGRNNRHRSGEIGRNRSLGPNTSGTAIGRDGHENWEWFGKRL